MCAVAWQDMPEERAHFGHILPFCLRAQRTSSILCRESNGMSEYRRSALSYLWTYRGRNALGDPTDISRQERAWRPDRRSAAARHMPDGRSAAARGGHDIRILSARAAQPEPHSGRPPHVTSPPGQRPAGFASLLTIRASPSREWLSRRRLLPRCPCPWSRLKSPGQLSRPRRRGRRRPSATED